MLSDYIFGSITEGWTIKDIQERDLYPVYVNMANSLTFTDEEKAQAKQERMESRLSKKRWEAYETFIDKYSGLYKQLGNVSVFGVPLIDDVETHQMSYIQRVVELAEIRSRFHLTFDFTCTTVDNTALEGMNLTQKIKYLTSNLPDLYQKGTQKFNPNIQDLFLLVKKMMSASLPAIIFKAKELTVRIGKTIHTGTFQTYHYSIWSLLSI